MLKLIPIGQKIINLFYQKYFKGIVIENKVGNIYQMTLAADSMYELINLAMIVNLFIAVTNEQHMFVSDDYIEKYIKILENINNVPYFVIYLFKIRLLGPLNLYNKHKNRLEKIVKNCTLTHGNTHDIRKEVIRNMIGYDNDIIDIGCGEMQYTKMFAKKMSPEKYYHAVDIDESFEKYANAINNRDGCNVTFNTLVQDIYIDSAKKYNVILTEVIEHLEINDAKKLILDSIKSIGFENINKLIITTPNKKL